MTVLRWETNCKLVELHQIWPIAETYLNKAFDLCDWWSLQRWPSSKWAAIFEFTRGCDISPVRPNLFVSTWNPMHGFYKGIVCVCKIINRRYSGTTKLLRKINSVAPLWDRDGEREILSPWRNSNSKPLDRKTSTLQLSYSRCLFEVLLKNIERVYFLVLCKTEWRGLPKTRGFVIDCINFRRWHFNQDRKNWLLHKIY